LLLILCSTLVRLFLAYAVGLGIDESYMAGVSRQVAWSYFDHPPLHVWLVGFWAKLFGEHPLTLRIPFIALFAGSNRGD
jgi:4-amino-4-deoxy-L-arabinose transferase-like glycosyltransferase